MVDGSDCMVVGVCCLTKLNLGVRTVVSTGSRFSKASHQLAMLMLMSSFDRFCYFLLIHLRGGVAVAHSLAQGTTMATTPTSSCQLLDLVIDMDWEKVKDYAQRNPEDAAFQDGDGLETPLYLACQYSAPVEVVTALLEAYSEAATTPSKRRDLPLHIACRFGSSVDVLKTLTENHPETAFAETRWGKTPLAALIVGANARADETEYGLWTKVKVLLEAVSRARILYSNSGERLLVHAAVSLCSLGCPEKVLDMVLEHCPEQTQMTDQFGRLPLHVALSQSKWSVQLRRRYKPRELYSIVSLLREYPRAAQVRHHGRYPLQMAVSNGHTWHNGVDSLFIAFPEAVLEIDAGTNLLPFQGAAIPVGESNASLDTIFQLLLAEPHVLEIYKEAPRVMEERKYRYSANFRRPAVVAVTVVATVCAAMYSSRCIQS
jgi:ankyrin repeat protein